MLYHRWRQVVATTPSAIALCERATGQRWTFQQLWNAGESAEMTGEKVVSPQGAGAQFVLGVLAGWRSGKLVCPLDQSQTAPSLTRALPADIVHLKTTSATTGAARMVAFTAKQLAADAANIVDTMGLQPEWPNLAVISLAHSYGFSNLVLPLLLHGIPLVLVGGVFPEALQQAAAEHAHVTLAAVPALWRTWHEARCIPPNVRLAISAGASLPLDLERVVFTQYGLKIHNFYGSSECGGIAYDSTASPREDTACAGRPLNNVTVTTAADGCLRVSSAAVGQMYWPKPDKRLARGVFHTRDVGEVTDGCVYLRGRAGDQINVAGRKVAPETIENVLTTHPLVRACLAFGIPCPEARRGEIIVACVATRPGLNRNDLKAFALSHLPDWQVPREWWLLDTLEANQRGKLSRAHWRRRYLERDAKARH